MPNQYTVVVRRPDDHHKGPKVIARFIYGDPVPPGVLIGKGAIIEIEGPRAEILTAVPVPC